MFGLSDTTVGAALSILLHAGLAVAFLGPLGNGKGAGETVVFVTIDGVEVPDHERVATTDESTADPLPIAQAQPFKAPEASKDLKLVSKEPPPPSAKRVAQPKKIESVPPTPEHPRDQQEVAQLGGGGLLGALYDQPRMSYMPKPAYPSRARQRGIEGKASIRVHITQQGSVDAAEVVGSSGHDDFDMAARESALQATFKPALRAGVPTTAEKTIVVTFSLVE